MSDIKRKQFEKIKKYSHKISIVNPDAISNAHKKVVCQVCYVMKSEKVYMIRDKQFDNWTCPKCGNVMVRHGSGYTDPEVAPPEISVEAVNDLTNPDNQGKMKSVSKHIKPDFYEDSKYVRKPGFDTSNKQSSYRSAREAIES